MIGADKKKKKVEWSSTCGILGNVVDELNVVYRR